MIDEGVNYKFISLVKIGNNRNIFFSNVMGILLKMGNKDTDTCQNMEGQRLQKAVEEAKQTQKLTPLIKEELRLSILNRRCLENKGEIELDEKKPVIKSELTPDEIRKKARRRQQNKDAARRCRAKKKRLESTVITDYFREQARAKELQEEVTSLRNTLAQLQRLLDEHAFSCQLAQAQSPPFHMQQTTNFTFPPMDGRYCYTDSFVEERLVENVTPLEDPFDDPTIKYSEAVMYPLTRTSPVNKRKTESTSTTCTVTCADACCGEEFDALPSDLIDLQIPETVFQQPCSPDLFLGRQSISDFLDEEPYCVNN